MVKHVFRLIHTHAITEEPNGWRVLRDSLTCLKLCAERVRHCGCDAMCE